MQYYPLVLYSIVPLVAATLYTFLAKALNDFEEHPTAVRKKNALVIKVLLTSTEIRVAADRWMKWGRCGTDRSPRVPLSVGIRSSGIPLFFVSSRSTVCEPCTRRVSARGPLPIPT